MKTSDSHQLSHISNTHSAQPFFGAKPEQPFFGKGRSQTTPFFSPSDRLSAIPSAIVLPKVGHSIQRLGREKSNLQRTPAEGVVQHNVLKEKSKLYQDLQNGTINIAIVGESHDEIDIEEEKKDWKQVDIDVFYENERLSYSIAEQEVTIAPDDQILRLWDMQRRILLHYAEERWENVVTFISSIAAELINWYLSDAKSEDLQDRKYIEEQLLEIWNKLNISLGELELQSIIDESSIDRGTELKLAEYMRSSDFINRMKLVNNCIKTFIARHYAWPGIEIGKYPDTSQMRGEKMLENINEAAPHMKRTIYKVGNSHIQQMLETEIKPKEKIRILDRETYISEYTNVVESLRPAKKFGFWHNWKEFHTV